MSTHESRGRRATTRNAFWRNNAFWIVVMPTSLVALAFILAMITNAVG